MAVVQASLFEFEGPKAKPLVRNPDHARNRLEFMLNLMRTATEWPWSAERVRFFRESLWPESYAALPPEDAAHYRSQIEAEGARLDAAARPRKPSRAASLNSRANGPR